MNAPLGDRTCTAFSGTLVSAGQGSGVVTATGPETEIGRISALIAGVETVTTPLLRQINRFGTGFTWVAMAAAVVLAQMAFTYLPAMQAVFDTRPVPFADGIAIVALGVGLMVMLEVEKTVLRRFGILREVGG